MFTMRCVNLEQTLYGMSVTGKLLSPLFYSMSKMSWKSMYNLFNDKVFYIERRSSIRKCIQI